MKPQEIDVRVRSDAPPEAVFALLRDASTWPTWSPINSFELERPADDPSTGVGEIRVFHTKRWSGTIVNREEILEAVPARRLSYTTLSGMPLRDYRADVDLEPDGTGTAIRWHCTFYPRYQGTGGMLRRTLATFIERTANGLAAHPTTTPKPT